MTSIGIDFGTTNSVVATHTFDGPQVLTIDTPPAGWASLGFDRVLPSVFALDENRQPIFGWAAKQRTTDRIAAVKRLLRAEDVVQLSDSDETFFIETIASYLFARLRDGAKAAGVDATDAVVTVPANSRGLARHRTKIAAGMVGLNVRALLNEPTAAAMAAAFHEQGDRKLMVFDWGGGTLDVTVLDAVEGVFIEKASKGIQSLGGLDLDARLASYVLEKYTSGRTLSSAERAVFMGDVELAKVTLSTRETVPLALPGGDAITLSRREFEGVIRPLVERTAAPVRTCLADLGDRARGIEQILMVGGSSNVPAVRSFVAELTGLPVATSVDPMTAIAEGAAIAAAILDGSLDTSEFFVATEHALGTVIGPESDQRFSALIPRNHALPASATDQYVALQDHQTSVNVIVIEGDPAKDLDHEDNVVLKEFDVALEPRLASDSAFDLTYEYDVNGILHVRAVDVATGGVLLDDLVTYGSDDEKRRLVGMARQVRDDLSAGRVASSTVTDSTDLDPEALEWTRRARTQVLPFLDGTEADDVRRAVERVESGETGTLDALRAALRPHSYLY